MQYGRRNDSNAKVCKISKRLYKQKPIFRDIEFSHYNDVIMGAMASQITSLTIVYSSIYSGADQRKLQSSASLAFVKGIHRWPVNSPHEGPVTRKMFPFDDVIMTVSPCGFREDTAPKQLTNHNTRNLSLVETGCLSGGLCGRQDLPHGH